MGTVISVAVRGTCPDDALDEVFAWFRWVDEVFSPYRADSAISRLGRGDLALIECPVEVADVLATCEDVRRASDGFFDVTADPRWPLDPCGYVKGWSAEVASRRLAAMGAPHHAISAGGDVRVRTPVGAPPWSVGVAHPFLGGELTASVTVGDGAVATSGTYERGCHVVDPHTGAAALDLAAVTIVGPDLGLADAFATAALAMGPCLAPAWIESLANYEGFIVDAGGGAWWSPGFAANATGLPTRAA
ncbi:MAG: FAD:protein transferase [Actinomycetota bacterium]